MKPPVLTILSTVCVVLLIGTCVLWVRSYMGMVGDDWPWGISSYDGHLEIRLTPVGNREIHHSLLGFSYAETSHTYTAFRGIGIPYWFIAALFAAFPVYRYLRRDRQDQPGLCRACGYDLRATPGRCPECGAISKAAAT